MNEAETKFAMPVEAWYNVDDHLHSFHYGIWNEEETEQWLLNEYGFLHIKDFEYVSKNSENISLFLLRWS